MKYGMKTILPDMNIFSSAVLTWWQRELWSGSRVYVALNESWKRSWMVTAEEIWKENIMTYSKVLSEHLLIGIDVNHEKSEVR